MTENANDRLSPLARETFVSLAKLLERLGASEDQLHAPIETGTVRGTAALAVISHPVEERTAIYVDVDKDSISVSATDDVWSYGDEFCGVNAKEDALSLIESMMREGINLQFRRRGPFTQEIRAYVPTDPPRNLKATELLGFWRMVSRFLPLRVRTTRDRIDSFVE